MATISCSVYSKSRAITALTAALAATTVLITACDGDHRPAQPPPWDPCSAFPDTTLRDAGVNPERKSQGQFPGESCTWLSQTNPDFSLGIRYASGDGAAEWKNGKDRDVEPITVGTHRGDLDHRTGENRKFVCLMRLDTVGGYVTFEFNDMNAERPDPCTDLTHIATVLEPHIPPAP
ncbi:DUF3558 family protein [Nocardia sp. NPDC050175]|uniref:DUF3558 family protein n=1 Tax=Nocardia sp. NPDC050175 TaxID=3364317 RepID=UPI003788F419